MSESAHPIVDPKVVELEARVAQLGMDDAAEVHVDDGRETTIVQELTALKARVAELETALQKAQKGLKEAQVEMFYNLEDEKECERACIQMLEEAEESIEVCAYSLDGNILDALKRKHQAGVKVLINVDAGQFMKKKPPNNIFKQTEAYFTVNRLVVAQGWWPFPSAQWLGSQHNKILIVDRKVVMTGSFNFSNTAATANLENCGEFTLADDLSEIQDMTHIDLSDINSLRGE